MQTELFEQLVAEAIESLPQQIQDSLENIDIVVADEPTPEQLGHRDLERGETLLGLYEGIPLTQRTFGYSGVMPDKITIFQKPIEKISRNNARLITEIQHVVKHEIAHHFGIDDDRLEEMGRY
ncbi:MAG: metallopeptidase family protein [Dehalococcoidales bacterium]|nr:metallopeptidase family protein [Dehalococcoidales bacterium]